MSPAWKEGFSWWFCYWQRPEWSDKLFESFSKESGWNAEAEASINIQTPDSKLPHFNWRFFFSAVPTKIGPPPQKKKHATQKHMKNSFLFKLQARFFSIHLGVKRGGLLSFLDHQHTLRWALRQGEIRWVGDLSTSDFCCCYVWPRMAERSGCQGCGGCGRHMQMVANTTGSSKGASKMDRRMASNNYIYRLFLGICVACKYCFCVLIMFTSTIKEMMPYSLKMLPTQ